MARIPVYGRSQTINPEPTFDKMVGGQGAVEQARALDDVGKNLVNFGQQVDRLQAAREKAQANDYAFKTYNDQFLRENQAERESKAISVDGHSQRMAQFWDKQTQEGVRNAPTELAAKTYQESAQRLQLQSLVTASNYENLEKAKYNRQKYFEQTDKEANSLLDSGDPQAYELLTSLSEESMDRDLGTAFSPTEIAKAKDENRQTRLKGFYAGFDSREEYQKGKALLHSDSKVNTDLDPVTRATLLRRFDAGLEQVGKREASSLKDQAHDLIYSAAQNGVTNPKAYNAVLVKVQNNKYIEPEDKARLVDNMKTSQLVAADVNRAQKLPESEWGRLASAQKDNKIFNAAGRGRIEAEFQSSLNEIRRQREKDPAQAVVNANPYIRSLQQKALASPADRQEYSQAVLSEQQRLGVPIEKQRVTTQAEADFVSEGLNQAIRLDSPDSLKVEVDKIISHYGDGANKVFEELVKDKHVDKGFFLVGQVETQAARKSIVYNLKNGKQINESYTQQFGKADDSELRQLVNRQTGDLVSAFNGSGGNNFKLGDAFQDQVLMESKKIKLSRSDLNDTQAVDLAKKRLVDENYEVIKGGRSTIVKARALNTVSSDDLSTFLSMSQTQDSIKKYNPDIPKAAQDSFGKDASNIFLSELSKRSRFVMSPDNKSLNMVVDAPDGGIYPVTSQGRQIQLPVDSIKDMSGELKKERAANSYDQASKKPGGY